MSALSGFAAASGAGGDLAKLMAGNPAFAQYCNTQGLVSPDLLHALQNPEEGVKDNTGAKEESCKP